jgi:hypothetical protein
MDRAAAPAGLYPRERLHPARRLRGHFRRHQTAEEDESLLGAAPQDPRSAGLAGPGESGRPGVGPPPRLLPHRQQGAAQGARVLENAQRLPHLDGINMRKRVASLIMFT